MEKNREGPRVFERMGPRLGSRGKEGKDRVSERTGLLLQWGRDLEVAERNVTAYTILRAAVLQWGRDLEVAESGCYAKRGHVAIQASMGPRLGSRGKTSDANHPMPATVRLQWGRDLEVAESGNTTLN